MAKRKPAPTGAARVAGPKKRPKKARSTKQGAEEKAKGSELDVPSPDSSAAETLATESRTVETTQHENNSNESFQDTEHSDEDDSEDAADGTINKENGCSDETETSCSFHRHVSHILTNEEVSTFMKQNCKFKWEIPAVDIPKSKWVGTGEKLQGDYDDHLHDVKGKLREHWQNTLSDNLSSRMSFFSLCNSYRDIMYCNKKPFYLKGKSVDSSAMDAYLMHALNHVHRTRDVVIRNDAKLRNDANRDILDDNSYLDQGFTRPKDDEMEKPEHSTKPADFDLLFAGDIDDHFLFGIKFTKKSVKLYSNFYASDIIVASPLALKRKIDGEDGKEKDFDFLSSIEIVVVDHADVILMQVLGSVCTVLSADDTLKLTSYPSIADEMSALFNRLCSSYEGKVKMVTEHGGVLPKIQLEVRQVYERFDASSIAEADDARFDYFCNKVYPKIQDSDEGGLLLFVSSYFEYIRISNFLKSKEASFCRIGE
ncbi:hypothetical protein EJB05_34709 [Eragrostis curvula]|uniref:U3 small nucleolar RNA-associated protein 25 n=1 Tax=Eragrostis curvula TaxID=38414 RepID=A0A5J9U4G6_9POAL|nr:hypothetical protein EJB05_34709 [Eragrostis curvula]